MTLNFKMRLSKTTKNKACFRENTDRIGRLYIPIEMLDEMNIGDEIILQLAPNKSIFPKGGYAAKFLQDKETTYKIRFVEALGEIGDLGLIYIKKDVLKHIGVQDEIAVRIVPSVAGRMIC